MKKSFLLIWIGMVLQVTHVRAEPFNRIGQGIRNLGMGNVGVALSHDENALYYNPAGLGGVDDFFVNLGLLFETSDDAINLSKELQEVKDADTSDTLSATLGKEVHYRLMAMTNIIVPFDFFVFGASALGEGWVDFEFENPALPNTTFSYQVDVLNTLGGAIPLGKGGLVIGASTRNVQRQGIYPPITLSIDNFVSAGNDSGGLTGQFTGADNAAWGQGYDLGIHWRIEGDTSMTVGVVAQNIGGMPFIRKGSRTYPRDVNAEYSAGISFQPGGDFFRFLYAFDIRDITAQGTSDSDYTKRVHTGVELGILPIDSASNFIAFRAGYNQGYATYGFEINPFLFARFITIQVAVYGEETGETAGSGKQARRLAQLSFAF